MTISFPKRSRKARHLCCRGFGAHASNHCPVFSTVPFFYQPLYALYPGNITTTTSRAPSRRNIIVRALSYVEREQQNHHLGPRSPPHVPRPLASPLRTGGGKQRRTSFSAAKESSESTSGGISFTKCQAFVVCGTTFRGTVRRLFLPSISPENTLFLVSPLERCTKKTFLGGKERRARRERALPTFSSSTAVPWNRHELGSRLPVIWIPAPFPPRPVICIITHFPFSHPRDFHLCLVLQKSCNVWCLLNTPRGFPRPLPCRAADASSLLHPESPEGNCSSISATSNSVR